MSVPENQVPTVLGADSEPPQDKPLAELHPNMDLRAPNQKMPWPTPFGNGYAVIGVEELLRRGFKASTEDEKANIIAAYLFTQKQNLSVFDTEETKQEKRIRLDQDVKANSTRQIFMLVIGILVALAILTVIGITIYTVSKQGVLSDNGLFQGMFTMLQEVFRVIMSGGKL